VIEANIVVMGVTRPVAPGPTDGNSGLVEIKDVIVLDSCCTKTVRSRLPLPPGVGVRRAR
jgi:hypothetical protein